MRDHCTGLRLVVGVRAWAKGMASTLALDQVVPFLCEGLRFLS